MLHIAPLPDNAIDTVPFSGTTINGFRDATEEALFNYAAILGAVVIGMYCPVSVRSFHKMNLVEDERCLPLKEARRRKTARFWRRLFHMAPPEYPISRNNKVLGGVIDLDVISNTDPYIRQIYHGLATSVVELERQRHQGEGFSVLQANVQIFVEDTATGRPKLVPIGLNKQVVVTVPTEAAEAFMGRCDQVVGHRQHDEPMSLQMSFELIATGNIAEQRRQAFQLATFIVGASLPPMEWEVVTPLSLSASLEGEKAGALRQLQAA